MHFFSVLNIRNESQYTSPFDGVRMVQLTSTTNISRKTHKCSHNLRQHRRCMYNVTLRRVRATFVAVVFVALCNQHAMRIRRIIL
jgi:hypothetical protein